MATMKQARAVEHSDDWGKIKVDDVPVPEPRDNDVLVKVVAAALNPVDHVVVRGVLKELWPEAGKLPWAIGYDFAGTIEKVGAGVTDLKAGDEVCGVQWGNGSRGGRYHADDADGGPAGGAFAEYVQVPASNIVPKPSSMSWETAAALGLVCQTAYAGVFDYNKVKSGDKVIIFGGSTAVGQLAVQLAVNAGAKVFATCSTGKMDFVKGLGATPIDYTTEKWWEVETGFDAGFCTTIADADAAHLKDEGVFKEGAVVTSVLTAGPSTEEGTPKIVKFVFHQNAEAMKTIVADVAAGKVKMAINKTWKGLTAANVAEIFTEQKNGKSVGKNVLLM